MASLGQTGFQMVQKLALVALAGALGTLARYGLSGLVQRLAGPAFPLGTFTVNVVGSFAFGLVFGVLESRLALSAQLRMLLLTGFMGAFTTFSTYMFESAALLRHGQYGAAFLNLGGQIVLGLALVMAGLALARTI